jgi:hypothetical protein
MKMRIQLFRLTTCGYYFRGTDERAFRDLGEWYRDFLRWVEEKKADYTLTSTFSERDEVPTSIYCTAATEDGNGSFGVALWNEGVRNREGMMFLPARGSVGSVQAEVVRMNPGDKPGWMSYFWVMPEKSIVVSLMPERAIPSISS